MYKSTKTVRNMIQFKYNYRYRYRYNTFINKLYFRDCKTGIYWKGSKKTIYESTKFKHVYKNVRRRIRI